MSSTNTGTPLSTSQRVEQLRVAGNEEFSRGRLHLALQRYSEALALATPSTTDTALDSSSQYSSRASLARICGNRSLVHAKLGMLEESLQDATQCISLDKSWPKGYFRLGMAFQALQRPEQALMSFELGVSFLDTTTSASVGDKKLAKEFSQQIAGLKKKTLPNGATGGGEVTLPMVTAARMAVTLRRERQEGWESGEQKKGMDNISVRTLSAGVDNRGVFAARNLPARYPLLAVPRDLLLTLQVAREESSICRKLDAALHPPSHSSPHLQLLSPNHCLLAVYMVQDRAKGANRARFWDYYESLPRDLSSMPVFWSEEELGRLKGSWFLQRVEDRKMGIQNDYSEIIRIAPEMEEVASLQDFTAMRMLVNSRVFATEIDGVETEWHFDQAAQAFVLSTTEEVARDEQLFDSYGAKCNSRYLLNYGFTVEDNRDIDGTCYNEISFEVCLDPQDPCYKIKRAMLPTSSSSWRLSMSMHFETMTNFNSFCYGRFIFASSREMSYLPRSVPPICEGFTLPSEKERGNIVRPISVANEKAVLQLFKEKALAQLAAYESTLKQDYARRRSLTPLCNAWHACNLLIGEKEVCQYLIDVCDECCRLFAMSTGDAASYVLARKKALLLRQTGSEVQNEIVDYLEKICLPLKKKEDSKYR